MARLGGFAFLLPIPVAFAYEPRTFHVAGAVALPPTVPAFLAAFAVIAVFWVPARLATRRIAHEDLPDREAYLTVAVGWLVMAAFAMLPFLLTGTIRNPVDAYFEAMSGLTGTGSTVLRDPSQLPASVLFWRALTQWLGGLGIIVLTVALLSKLTHGGLQMFRGDVAGQAPTRIQPRLAEIARGLWRIYVAFTLVFIVLLAALLHLHTGYRLAPAVLAAFTDTFSAFGNSAFSSHPSSVAYYGDPAVEALLAAMMVAGAINFTLVFVLLRRGRWRPLWQDPELRFFLAWTAAGVAAVTLILVGIDHLAAGVAARQGAFTAVSLATGTGLANSVYAHWPQAATMVLFLLVLVGGTAGSAAGGVKAFRALLLLRTVRRELRRILHPRAIIPVRVGGRAVPEETVTAVVAFFFSYLIAWVAGAILLAVLEPHLGIDAAAGASLSALGNVGTHFGVLASAGHDELGAASKILLTGLMWFGRMELFAALLVFTPSSWKD